MIGVGGGNGGGDGLYVKEKQDSHCAKRREK